MIWMLCVTFGHDWQREVAWNDRDFTSPLLLVDLRFCRRCGKLHADWRVQDDWRKHFIRGGRR